MALIGDSYVEALQVPVGESPAAAMEEAPGRDRVEALRFRVSGAPLSQHLRVLEWEALPRDPDAVTVVLIDNDLDEPIALSRQGNSASFACLRIEGGAVVAELEARPQPVARYPRSRQTAIAKLCLCRQRISARRIARALLAADNATHRQRLDFQNDRHWNARAHRLVGRAIADALRSPAFPPPQ